MEQPEHWLQQGPWPWGLCGAQGKQDPTEEPLGPAGTGGAGHSPLGWVAAAGLRVFLVLAHSGALQTPKGQEPLGCLCSPFWAGWAGGSWLQPLLTAACSLCHCSSAPGHSLPPEVLPHCFIEFDIIRSIKVPKLLDHLGVYLHVSPALGLAQAARQAAAL